MNLYEGIKDAAKVLQQADNVELYSKLIDLSREALEVTEENKRLKKEIDDYKKAKDIEDRLVFRDNAYYLNEEGPYCSVCWDKDKKLVRMHYVSGTRYDCCVCKISIGKSKTYDWGKINKNVI